MSWQRVKVGDLITQVRGVSYSSGDAIDKFKDGYVELLRANNIADGHLVFDDVTYVPKSKVNDKQYLRQNDIVIAASSGSISVVGKAASFNSNHTATFGAFCKVLRPKENVDARYIANYFQTTTYRRTVSSLAAGANINNLRNEHIDNLDILLPPLAEQKRIAAILDKAAEIKAKREQAIAKLDELAMSTFMKMFGNQPDSVETTLGECLRLINGRAYLQHELLNEGTPIIRIQNLNGGNRWYYSNLKLPEEKYCDNGDLLFAWSATFGPYIWRGNKSIYHYHIWKIEPKELFDKTFAFYLLQSITREIKNASHGASMLHMTKSGMEAWPIKLPPLKAQMRFVEFANRLQSIREAMEESKGIIFDKEKSLQHQAFTAGFNA
jgi:type I restriction enzyme, S subunit